MNTSTVIVDGHRGLIFEGEIPETYCFVPHECVSIDQHGLRVNEIEYARSGWHARNMRLNDSTFGNFLFPKQYGRLVKLDTEPIRHFLERTSLVRCA